MARAAADLPPKGGFSFDLCCRNNMLLKKGLQMPSFRKTGTTIVGLVFQVHEVVVCLKVWSIVVCIIQG